MKLRVRRHETAETLKLEFPDTCTLDDLRRRIHASDPSSVHLSLNRRDELIAPSPEDRLRSLGVTSGDLIYYSLEPNTSVASLEEVEFASSEEAQQTLVQDGESSGGKLGEQETLVSKSDKGQPIESSSTGTRSRELDIAPENRNVSMNIQNQAETDLNSGTKEQIEGSMPVMDEVEPMHIEYGELEFSTGKRLSEPFFLKKVLMEQSGDTSELTFLVTAVHAVMLESGFSRFDPGSGLHAEKFCFSNKLRSVSLRYTLPERSTRGDFNKIDSVKLRFQSLGHVVIVYGSLSERSSAYRVNLDKRRFVPAIDLVMDTLKSDKEGSSSMYGEVFDFWKIVKDGLAIPLLIGLCDMTGLELPPCLMRLPTELKLKILESLPGVDIARMACLCSEMRHVSSNNDLWKQKWLEEFGRFTAEVKDVVSWKAEFVACWETTKRRGCGLARRIRPTFNRFPPIFRDPFPTGFPPITWYDGDHLPSGIPFHPRQRTQGFGRLQRQNFSPRCNLGGLN